MAFRKRNVPLGQPPRDLSPRETIPDVSAAGVRRSSVASLSVTSTGTPSLDGLLGGHGGLVLGTSLLVQEDGTTDFAGALLRFYAAEGICHGHVLHVVGMGNAWIRDLPGVADQGKSSAPIGPGNDQEKMKIAWRCSTLLYPVALNRKFPLLIVKTAAPNEFIPAKGSNDAPEDAFCHTFDLSKRLVVPPDANINYLSMTPATSLDTVYRTIARNISASPANSIHRLVIPSVLNPAIYPPSAARPENFLSFMRDLRCLLRLHSNKLTAMISLPLDLYPRRSGLVRWAEILSDGVLTLTSFAHLMDSPAEGSGNEANKEQPQGLVKIHKLPINTERGDGGAGVGNSMAEDLTFTVSRRKFIIKAFHLPPIDGDQDAQVNSGALTAKDVEF